MVESAIRECVIEILEGHMSRHDAVEATYYNERISDMIDELTTLLENTIEFVEIHGITW